MPLDPHNTSNTVILETPSLSLDGVSGLGFLEIVGQNSPPTAPNNGGRLYFDSSGNFCWLPSLGKIAVHDLSNLTTLRTYHWPDATGTVLLDTDATFTNRTFGAGSVWQGEIIAPKYLGSGSASSTTFLRGDGVWASPPGGGGGSPTGSAGGDLGNNYPNPSVRALQGNAISATGPTSGQVLAWDGFNWTPTTLGGVTPGGPAGGSLSGTYPNPDTNPAYNADYNSITIGSLGLVNNGPVRYAPVPYVGTGISLNFGLGYYAAISIIGNTTFTAGSYGAGSQIVLDLTNSSGAGRVIAWPSGWTWIPTTGVPPTSIANGAAMRVWLTSSTGLASGVMASYMQTMPVFGTAAFKDVPTSGNASSTQVVLGSDTRLAGGTSVPGGGATHAFLAKNSGTSGDVGWFGPYVFNVGDYPHADPTGATDSVLAFNAAIGDLNASPYGGTLVIPQGIWQIGSSMGIINNHAKVQGGGRGITTLRFTGANWGIQIDYASAGALKVCTVESMTINTDTVGGQIGLYYRQFSPFPTNQAGSPFIFRDLEFSSVTSGGCWDTHIMVGNARQNDSQGGSSISNVHIGGSTYSGGASSLYGIRLFGATNVKISNVSIFNVVTGFYIDGSSLCEDTSITDCIVIACKCGVESHGASTTINNMEVDMRPVFGSPCIGVQLFGNEWFVSQLFTLNNDPSGTGLEINGAFGELAGMKAYGSYHSSNGVVHVTGSASTNKIHDLYGTSSSNPGPMVVMDSGSAFNEVRRIMFQLCSNTTAIQDNSGANSIHDCWGTQANTDTFWTPAHY